MLSSAQKMNLNFEEGQLFKSIGEVSAELSIPPHVLRFWEGKFNEIKPHKRKGGHRYYRPSDVEFIKEIKSLLYDFGYTIKGAQKHLRDKKRQEQMKVIAQATNQANLFGETEESKKSLVANDYAEDENKITKLHQIASNISEIKSTVAKVTENTISVTQTDNSLQTNEPVILQNAKKLGENEINRVKFLLEELESIKRLLES